MRASRNIQLGRVGLVMSVVWELGTGMDKDHIVSAPVTLQVLK